MTDPSRRVPSRREVVVAGMGAFVVGVLPLAARRPSRVVRRTVPLMGTVAELTAVHRDAAVAEAALDAAFAELHRVERLMSRFRADSDIGRANAAAGERAVIVDGETAGVVRAALEWADASAGRFDPALGVVNEVWEVGSRLEPPSRLVLGRLAGRHLYRGVDLGRSSGEAVVALRERDVHLDLGGIAKGHGVDRAVAALRDRGVLNGIVSVGGDLYALGRRPDGDPWRVGVRSPHEPSRLMGAFEAEDEAVATSGDYERFFRHRGIVYHHLMDPATAAPVQSTRHSVTVRADCCRDADAAATVVFGLEPIEAARMLGTRGRATLVSIG